MSENSAGIVLVHKDMVVLVKRPKGYWEIPKGHIEVGESSLSAAIRETIEETSIDNFKIVDGWKVTVTYEYWWEKRKVKKSVDFYIGIVDDFVEPIPSKEHVDAKWFHINEAIRKVKFHDLKDVLLKVKDYLKNEGSI